MLLGSGKASIESTQTPIDTTVVATTNLEEMTQLERQLTSSKLLDRIEEVPVNYLLDAYSEMDILKRDMANIREKYDVDPNLFRIATYFSVLTRLLPPRKIPVLANWSNEKKACYASITPEQKLFIYTAQPTDPRATIEKLPEWHPFRSELARARRRHRPPRPAPAPLREPVGPHHPRAVGRVHRGSAPAHRRRLHARALERALPLRGQERHVGSPAPERDAGHHRELERVPGPPRHVLQPAEEGALRGPRAASVAADGRQASRGPRAHRGARDRRDGLREGLRRLRRLRGVGEGRAGDLSRRHPAGDHGRHREPRSRRDRDRPPEVRPARAAGARPAEPRLRAHHGPEVHLLRPADGDEGGRAGRGVHASRSSASSRREVLPEVSRRQRSRSDSST